MSPVKPSLKDDRHVTVDASGQSPSTNSSGGIVIVLDLVHHTVKDVLEKILDAVLEQVLPELQPNLKYIWVDL